MKIFSGKHSIVDYMVTLQELKKVLKEIPSKQGLIFLEVKVKKQTRMNLGRPKGILELKESFCKEL